MDFQILGPVELTAHEGRVDLGPLKQRTVLAALLFDAGRPVTQELLISRVWDGCPPAEVRKTLYTYVARLRRILASVPGAEGARLLRRSGGYLLDVDPGTVDAHRFTEVAAEARAPGLSEEQRCELASRALAEFAAAPLTDLTCQWAGRVRELLVRRQRDMIRLHATLAIRLGHAVSVVDRLYGVLVEQPLAEEMAGILMSALYFSGRSAEALELFARTRAAIAAELGVEPGPELRRTHEEILRGELTCPARGALMERPSYLAQPGVPEPVREDPAGESRPAAPARARSRRMRACAPGAAPSPAKLRGQPNKPRCPSQPRRPGEPRCPSRPRCPVQTRRRSLRLSAWDIWKSACGRSAWFGKSERPAWTASSPRTTRWRRPTRQRSPPAARAPAGRSPSCRPNRPGDWPSSITACCPGARSWSSLTVARASLWWQRCCPRSPPRHGGFKSWPTP